MTKTFQNAFPVFSAPVFSKVFIDFDGTIADNDVTDVLLERFAAHNGKALKRNGWLARLVRVSAWPSKLP